MNSSEIFDCIEKIASVSGKLQKLDLLAQAIIDPQFKNAVWYAYNPLIRFGIASKSLESMDVYGSEEFSNTTWGLLELLKESDLTGNAALEAIQAEFKKLSPDSCLLLRRILLKDMRAGFSESSLNKVCPGLIPEFPYMRCSLPEKSNMEKWDWSVGKYVQEKADGMFVNVNHTQAGEVRVLSRAGTEFPSYVIGDFIKTIKQTLKRGTQTHGELLVLDKDRKFCAREIGNGMLNSLTNGGALENGYMLVIQVWDQLPLKEVVPNGKYHVGYEHRYNDLVEQVENSEMKIIWVIPTIIAYSKAEAFAYYKKLLRQNKEGVIVKERTAIWQDSTSKDQVKLKVNVDVDLAIVAVVPGSLDSKNEGRPGSLTCMSDLGDLVTDVTVKNEAMREAIEKNSEDWIGKIIVVRANQLMLPSDSNLDHSLFLPRFVESNYRKDKTTADSLEQIKAQFKAAYEGHK